MGEMYSISDLIQNCFNELYRASLNANGNYINAVEDMVVYLTDDRYKRYDCVMKNYPCDKDMIFRMLFPNFMEITYYRKYLGIKLDSERQFFLDKANDVIDCEEEHFMDCVYCSANQLAMMINDVLLYFWHYSPIYSYNAVKSFIDTKFANYLYEIYPYAKFEHNLTIENSIFKGKEYLLFTLYEIVINETERIEFEKGLAPMPESDYLMGIDDLINCFNGEKDEDGKEKEYNLHRMICDEFKKRTNIDLDCNSINDFVEIVIKMLLAKREIGIPFEGEEATVLKALLDRTENYSIYYNLNNKLLFKIVLNNLFYIDRDIILGELPNKDELLFIK